MTTTTVELEHSTGKWVTGTVDLDTAHDLYPRVLFANTDRWTNIHRNKIRKPGDEQGTAKVRCEHCGAEIARAAAGWVNHAGQKPIGGTYEFCPRSITRLHNPKY